MDLRSRILEGWSTYRVFIAVTVAAMLLGIAVSYLLNRLGF